MQTEAFGTVSLVVVAKDVDQLVAIAADMEGNLTGCLYSHSRGEDDAVYDQVAPVLRTKGGPSAQRQDAHGRRGCSLP
ncbi:MAG: hypothetical protein R2838_09400 [Caldilineaceae bacterium]